MKTKVSVKDWFGFYAPRFYLFSIIMGIITRIILILHPMTVTTDFTALTWLKVFGVGLVNDLAFATLALIPAFILYSFFTDRKYSKPAVWILGGALTALTLYVVCFNDITDEYAGVVPGIANALLILITACFWLKVFLPGIRSKWRTGFIWFLMMLYAFLIVLNVISESVFWDEIGVRYNFIAVDYLVYTNEVIGNIFESYPMVPILIGVLALAGGICWLMVRGHDVKEAGIGSWKQWLVSLALLAVLSFAGIKWLHWGYFNLAGSGNIYEKELQENGCWDFLEAYNSNELEYDQFYEVIPQDKAVAKVQEMTGMDADGIQRVSDSAAVRKNIVLITVESLSADFLGTFGDDRNITPNLDRLAEEGICFDNLFATGNRTVRGLEAVTLCIPPAAGESIIKRPENARPYSTGSILKSLGYSATFVYGGFSYFDNMEAFFTNNGYEVLDKNSFLPEEITYDNIWGTCDEDSFNASLRYLDSKAASGNPFFAHIMTISNHRPYTYPEGRIEYEGNPMSRAAAVKYTDYSIGKFLDDASRKDWFDNTVFVILADHCASSAGKTSIPLDGYHIPCIIYAPGFIEPQHVDKVCSQIDIVPTLFSLLGFSYESDFNGRDILDPEYRERAFMATYQDLGYYADGILTVLSPVRQVKQFEVEKDSEGHYTEVPMENARDEEVLFEAQAFYQIANQ